jgi:hypothetical protein
MLTAASKKSTRIPKTDKMYPMLMETLKHWDYVDANGNK